MKITGKVVLSRLPLSPRIWHRVGLFSPGEMRSPAYAVSVFQRHFRQAGAAGAGFRYLELGPGGSMATALVAWAHGAGGGYLVDTEPMVPYATTVYQDLLSRLAADGASRDLAPLMACSDSESMLRAAHATYLEEGLQSLRGLRSEDVDFLFSHAVLEHVPRKSFAEICGEFYRILKPGGTASHVVDFQDHLGGSLHNLRFSERLWEAPWFARRSGFYTNRLRYSDMLEHFERAGFKVDVMDVNHWSTLPLPRHALHVDFQNRTKDDLHIAGAHFRLTKRE
ncbi:MAG: methyltransferase domain-containing protein [Alphaproteobacteria bacterium]|nr:methyltransferase domain-containing protein [Alphaproteobacteria bacterium]